MKSKWWWVIGMVIMVATVLVATSRATAAPVVATDLGSQEIALGTTIDDLTVAGDVLIDEETTRLVRGDSILRGERDVAISRSEQLYQWDGTDSSTDLRIDGLGGWDATNNGLASRFVVDFGAGRAASGTLTLYDGAGGTARTTVAIPATEGEVSLPFTAFTGVNFTRLGAVELRVPNGVTLLGIRTESDLRATRSATLVQDINGNGRPEKGDVVDYAITFTHQGQSALGTAAWSTTLQGRNSALQGIVSATGANARSERAGNGTLIRADLSELAAGSTATVRYSVLLQGGAIPISIVLEEGDVLPEGTVGTLNSPFTNGNGDVGFVGNLGATDRLVWFDTGIIWQNSDAAPTNTLTGAEGTMGIGNSGQFIYSPTANGNDAVWTQAGLLLAGTQPAPNYPPPTTNTFNSRPHMMPNGTSLWVAGASESGTATTTQRVLYNDADGAPGGITTALQTNTNYDGIPITAPAGIEFDYQQSDNLTNLIVTLDLNTGSNFNDAVLGLNGNIVAQEGVATGGGDNWSNFDSPSVNNAGNFVFAGDTDGATTTDEFIAYGTTATTPTIGIREGSTLDGILLNAASVNALSLNNQNQAAFIWTYTGGETLFVACDATNLAGAQAILSVGDDYDGDGGGSDGFINDFNASAAIGPGLWVAEDGFVYAEVDLAPPIPFFGGTREAVIGVATGCSTGGTPTPTNTTVPPTSTATPTNTTVPSTNTPTATATPGGGGNRFCSTTPIVIPDANPTGATGTINVPLSTTISDLNVIVTGTHTWVGDIRLTISHSATDITFYDQPGVPASTFGCSGDNLPGVVADDEGVNGSFENSCQNATPAYTPGGSYFPNTPLIFFDNTNSSGTWTLTAADLAAGDTGTIDSWCVEFGTGPLPSPTPSSTAGTPNPTPTFTPTSQPTAPDINVTPNAFTEDHTSPPQTTNDTMNIQNVGTGSLTWTITEDDTRPGTLMSAKGEYLYNGAVQDVSGFSTSGVAGDTIINTPNVAQGSLFITHSSTQNITALNSVSCNAGGLHTDNSYYRVYDLAGDFGITQTIEVDEVSFGVEQATGATGTQPVTVNLYTLTGVLNTANLTLIGSEAIDVPDSATGTVFSVPVSPEVVVPAGSVLVVELFTPNGQTAGNSFFIGSNADPETDPSYLRAADCGVAQPTATGAIGFPNMHIVMNVSAGIVGGGACSAPTDIPWLTVSPTNGSTAGGGSTPVTLTYNSTSLAQGTYTGTLCIASNDADEALVTVPITLNVGLPTAIDLSSFTSPVSGVSFADLAAAGLLLLAGAVLVLRRK